MEKILNKNHKKWPRLFSIPVFILIAIVFWQIATGILNIVMTYIGGLGMMLTMPIIFCTIIGPMMDSLLEWYDKKFS